MTTSRLQARKLRFLESELAMLQKFVSSSESLLSEYEKEYYQDINFFKTQAGTLSSQPDVQEESAASESEHIGQVSQQKLHPRYR